MKLYVSALMVALILAALHVGQSEAWLFNNNEDDLEEVVCSVCPIGCMLIPGVNIFCAFACTFACARKKRDLRAEQKVLGRHLTPMAISWATYDINEDNVIGPEELAAATGVNKTDSSFQVAFKMADTNGDGVLSKAEFYQGPFVFETDVEDEEYARCRYLLDLNGNGGNTGSRVQQQVPPA